MPTVFDGPLPSNTMVQGVLWDGWKWINDTTIYYYFNSSGTDTGIQGWAANEKASYRAATAAYSAVANINFQEVFTRESANFIENIESPTQAAYLGAVLGWHDSPFDARVAHTVDLGAGRTPSYAVNQAAGFYNYMASGSHWANDLAVGSKNYQSFMHEIGHGIGLKHPWSSIGSAPQFPNVTTAGVLGSNNLAHNVYTIMSYSGNYTYDAAGIIQLSGATLINGNVWNEGYNKTLAAFDIAAVQFLYGARDRNTGNNSYRLQDAGEAELGWECIWDSGGTADEIYYAGSRNAVIDLTAATLDNTATGGGVLSYASGVRGGFTIANGVVIEKATGGSGNDTLSGNSSANIINGRGGLDVLTGRGGGDTFVFDNDAFYALDRVTDYDMFGGDRIDVSALVYHSYFTQPASSLVRAVADATNSFTIVQVDTDGLASGPNWRDIARLENVQQGHLVRALLTPSGSYTDLSVIRAPVITSNGGGTSASTTITENSTYVTTINATNYAGGSLNFSLSGSSAYLFRIELFNAGTSANIYFINGPNYENASERSFSFDVNVSDLNGLADTQTIFVGVTNVQEGPVFSGGSSVTINVQENRTSVVTVSATDPEGSGVSYSISGGADRSLFAINGSGQLSFLSAPDFESPADADRNNSYLVQVRAADTSGVFSDQMVTVNVTDVAENAPRFTSHGGLATAHVNIGENTTSVTTLTAVDPDGTTPTLSIISGLDSAFFTLINGALSFRAAPDHEAPADSNRDNWYEVVVRASDGSLFADQKIVAIVNNVNEAPTITTNGGGATATINVQENLAGAVTTVAGVDPEGAGLVYSIVGGVDAARFGIGVFNGLLTFNSAPDFESPGDSDRNNSYTVIVRASDGGAADDQVITVNVGNVAEAPIITSWGGGVTATVVVTTGSLTVGTVTAYDGDGTTPTYGIAGGVDAAKFQINAATGVLSFRTAPDVSVPTDANQDNTYLVTVVSSDGVLTDQQMLSVQVKRALIDGTEGNDNRIGTSVSEEMYGRGGDDTLYGEGGDDVLIGGAGNDHMDGGAGVDTLSFEGATTGMTLVMGSLGPRSGQVFAGEPIGMDTFANIENVICGEQGDTVGCDDMANRIEGRGGNDIIFGWTNNDVLWGGEGDDQLFGQQDNDTIRGGNGNDRIYGWAGSDDLWGEAGADTFVNTDGIAETLDRIWDYSYAQGDLIDVVGNPGSYSFGQFGTDVLIFDPQGQPIFQLVAYNLSNGLAIV